MTDCGWEADWKMQPDWDVDGDTGKQGESYEGSDIGVCDE